MFGRATIKLGIGPHSSIILFIYVHNIAFRDSDVSRSGVKRNENELELSRKMQQQYMRKW